WIYVRMRTSSTCVTSQFNTDSIKITLQLPAPGQPVIVNLATDYCKNQGVQKAKLGNYPPQGIGMTVTVKLDGNNLTLGADTSFSFDVSALAAGNHSIEVTYANSSGTKTTTANFTVAAAVTPDVNLTSGVSSIEDNNPVTITASNASGGGTSPAYTFAKDRSFTSILQAEGAASTLTLAPGTLALGENKIYVRMKTSLSCYTQQTAIDSIVITRFGSVGLVDPDFPNQTISLNPNPFRSKFTVNGLNASKTYTIMLYSQQGRLMYKMRVVNRATSALQVPGQAAGIYMLSIYDETKKRLIGTMRVLKQ
ncbi:MAG: T9SS type A sorting domain-containing protein, partial [Chitinophagaceae bacterium]